jgi:hypothetical protein
MLSLGAQAAKWPGGAQRSFLRIVQEALRSAKHGAKCRAFK